MSLHDFLRNSHFRVNCLAVLHTHQHVISKGVHQMPRAHWRHAWFNFFFNVKSGFWAPLITYMLSPRTKVGLLNWTPIILNKHSTPQNSFHALFHSCRLGSERWCFNSLLLLRQLHHGQWVVKLWNLSGSGNRAWLTQLSADLWQNHDEIDRGQKVALFGPWSNHSFQPARGDLFFEWLQCMLKNKGVQDASNI